MKNLFLLLFSLFTVFGISQNALKPVVWHVSYIETTYNEGNIVFTALIEDKWHIYSQRPTDVGPIPTSFTISPNSSFELVGNVIEKDAHEEFVAAFDAKVFVFSGEAVFTQKIIRKNKKAFSINTSLEFMTCNDVQCLPPTTLDFVVLIPDEVIARKK